MVTSILKTDGLTPPYWLRGKSPTLTRLLLLLVLMLSLPLTAGAWSDLHIGNSISTTWDAAAPSMTVNTSNPENEFTATLTPTSSDDVYFRIYGKILSGNAYGYLVPDNNGDAVDPNKTYTAKTSQTDGSGQDKAFKITNVTANQPITITALYTNEGGSDWYWKLTVTTSSSGGGGSDTPITTVSNKDGLYIYGNNYDGTSITSSTKLHYKLLKRKDNEYYISILGTNLSFGDDFTKFSENNKVTIDFGGVTSSNFKLAYVKDNNVTTYSPSSSTQLQASPTVTSASQGTLNADGNNQWTLADNQGYYNLVVVTDANGVPQNWYYESDDQHIVAYQLSEKSDWTTYAYLLSPREKNDNTKFSNNFFGLVDYVKDGEFAFLFWKYWFKQPNSAAISVDQKHQNIGWDDTGNAPNLTFKHEVGNGSGDYLPSGVYLTEFNPTRGNYILSGDQTPNRVFIIGSAVTGEEDNDVSQWKLENAKELVWNDDEQCYKGVFNFTNGKHFRFLLDHQTSGDPASISPNFAETAATPGTYNGTDDTDYSNHVNYYGGGDTETALNNIVFNPESNSYTVRFYVQRSGQDDGFQWGNNGVYLYTLESNSQMTITLDPEKKDVAYNTPQTVVATITRPFASTLENNYYAFTVDGSEPQLSNLNSTPTPANDNTYIINYSTVSNANKIITNRSIVLERTSLNGIKLSTTGKIEDAKELSGWTLNDDHSINVTIKAVALRNVGTINAPTYAVQGSATSELTFLRKQLAVTSTVADATVEVPLGQTYEPDIDVEDDTQEDKDDRYYVFTFGNAAATTNDTQPALKGDGTFTAGNSSYIGQYKYYKAIHIHEIGTLWRTVDGKIKFTYYDVPSKSNKTLDLTEVGRTEGVTKSYDLKIFAQGVKKTGETYAAEGNVMQINVSFKDILVPNFTIAGSTLKMETLPGSFTNQRTNGEFVGVNGVWILPYIIDTSKEEKTAKVNVTSFGRRPRRALHDDKTYETASANAGKYVFMYRVKKVADGDESSDATWSTPEPVYEHDYTHSSSAVGNDLYNSGELTVNSESTVALGLHLTDLPLGPNEENKVQIWLSGDESTRVTIPFDITYSTSEAGYTTVLDGDRADLPSNFGKKPGEGLNRSSSTGLISVYVRAKDGSAFTGNPRVTAYERLSAQSLSLLSFGGDEQATPLTNADGKAADAQVEVGGKKWYRFTFDVGDTWHNMNMLQSIGIQVIDDSYNPSNGYVPYINDIQSDIFLEYDPSTHVCTDVTRKYTSAHFYATNKFVRTDSYKDYDGGEVTENVYEYSDAKYVCPSKIDAFNPSSSDKFIIVEVPSVFNSLYTGGKAKVTVSVSGVPSYDGVDIRSNEISYSNSKDKITTNKDDLNNEFYKVSISGATEGQDITFGIYSEKNLVKTVTAKYYNGGYYSLSDMTAGLRMIFTPDEAADKDQRSDEYFNYNRVPDNGDLSYKIRIDDYSENGETYGHIGEAAFCWKPLEESNIKLYNGLTNSSTVYKVSSSAKPTSDEYGNYYVLGGAINATAGSVTPLEDGTYTVQAIVKAAEEESTDEETEEETTDDHNTEVTATAQLSLNGATSGDGFASRTITSSDDGTVNKYGRVDDNSSDFYTPTPFKVYDPVKGWYKLEAKAKPENGMIKITVSTGDNAFYLSDLVLLKDANNDAATDGNTVWTTAGLEQSKAVGSGKTFGFKAGSNYKDLSDRGKANSFSFFDRGENHNGIVFISGNTAPGGMLYNPNPGTNEDGTPIDKHDTRSEVNVAVTDDNGSTFKMKKLVLDDAASERYNLNDFGGFTEDLTAEAVSYNQNFSARSANGSYGSICVPFELTSDMLGSDVQAYELSRVSIDREKHKATVYFKNATLPTTPGAPYVLHYTSTTTGTKLKEPTTGTFTIASQPVILNKTDNGDYIYGSFNMTTVDYNNRSSSVFPNKWIFYNGTFVPAIFDGETYSNGTDKPKTLAYPFRAVFEFSKKTIEGVAEGTGAKSNKNMRMYFAIDNGETTGINDVENYIDIDGVNNNAPIYNLSGQLVSHDGNTSGLPKGIYIQNNRKFVVR